MIGICPETHYFFLNYLHLFRHILLLCLQVHYCFLLNWSSAINIPYNKNFISHIVGLIWIIVCTFHLSLLKFFNLLNSVIIIFSMFLSVNTKIYFSSESVSIIYLFIISIFLLACLVIYILAITNFPVFWPPHAKSWLIGKDSGAGRDWGQEEKGMTEDEMARWHHWLGGREFEWTLGVGDG